MRLIFFAQTLHRRVHVFINRGFIQSWKTSCQPISTKLPYKLHHTAFLQCRQIFLNEPRDLLNFQQFPALAVAWGMGLLVPPLAKGRRGNERKRKNKEKKYIKKNQKKSTQDLSTLHVSHDSVILFSLLLFTLKRHGSSMALRLQQMRRKK